MTGGGGPDGSPGTRGSPHVEVPQPGPRPGGGASRPAPSPPPTQAEGPAVPERRPERPAESRKDGGVFTGTDGAGAPTNALAEPGGLPGGGG
eukprot:8291163-Alexandrium_andersonii.AAC.1